MFAKLAERVLVRVESDLDESNQVPAEKRRVVQNCRTRLLSALAAFDRAPTTLDRALAWNHRVRYPLHALQQRLAELSGPGATSGPGQTVRWGLAEIQSLERDIRGELDDPVQKQSAQVQLFEEPLIPFALLRRRVRILNAAELDKFTIGAVLNLPVATRDWLLHSNRARERALVDSSLQQLADLRLGLAQFLLDADRKMADEGSSAREARLRKLALRVYSDSRQASRICKQEARRWYRLAIRDLTVRDRFPLTANVKLRRGSVVLDDKVGDSLDSLAYNCRMYAALVDRAANDIVRKLSRNSGKSGRALKKFMVNLGATFASLQGGRESGGLLGQLGDLLSSASEDLASSFSGAEQAIGELKSECRSAQHSIGAEQRRIDGLPGILYQSHLRMRGIPETTVLAMCGEKIGKQLQEVLSLEQGFKTQAGELAGRYQFLTTQIAEITDWCRKNDGKSADEADRRALGRLFESMAGFDTNGWARLHRQADSVGQKLDEAAQKLAEMLR